MCSLSHKDYGSEVLTVAYSLDIGYLSSIFNSIYNNENYYYIKSKNNKNTVLELGAINEKQFILKIVFNRIYNCIVSCSWLSVDKTSLTLLAYSSRYNIFYGTTCWSVTIFAISMTIISPTYFSNCPGLNSGSLSYMLVLLVHMVVYTRC